MNPIEADSGERAAVLAAAPAVHQLSQDPFWEESARLGEAGGRLGAIWNRAGELSTSFLAVARDAGFLPGSSTPPDRDRGMQLALDIGRESLALIEETFRLEGDGEGQSGIARKALALAARASLFFQLAFSQFYIQQQVLAIESGVSEMNAAQSRAATAEVADWTTKLALIGEVIAVRTDLWRTVIELAKQLNDGEGLPNLLILAANSGLEEFVETPDEKLALVRDSVIRSRLLAAANPGSSSETLLAMMLRQEGAICNDLGRPDEAVRAFARADEIIDRYPAADPNLLR